MISIVPDGWSKKIINECCEILDSQRVPLNSEERAKRKGEYPYYGANGVQGYIDDFIFEGDAILIAEDGGNFDQYADRPIAQWVTGKFWVNNHAHILRAKDNATDKWIFYSLVHKNILKNINGGTRAKLNQSDLKEIEILLSPLPEQKKITSILTSVDEVIENTQKQIDKLQDLKRATMNELLTKGIGHTKFKDSELGQIPKSWEVKKVSELSSLVTNGFVGSASSHYRETGTPYLVSKNIRDNFIDQRGLTYISREFHEKTSKSKLVQGDLLTVQSGHVGTSAVVTDEYDGANCHALILTRFNGNSVNSNFMAYYLNSSLGRLRLSIYFVGSTIVHLNTSDLKKFAVPVPTLKEQENIVSIVNSVQNQIDTQFSKLSQTQSLKKSLLQDLLAGKVRVTVN